MNKTVIKLPIEPYNRTFINCITNNLIAVLKTHNDSFENMDYSLARSYSLFKLKDNKFLSEDARSQILGGGLLTLELTTESPDVEKYFEIKQIDLTEGDNIHILVKEMLLDGYYIFLETDRYHFPDGIEYNKRSFIHPTFIYGIDDVQQKYFVIEDCITPRLFEHYEITFSQIDKAFKECLPPQTLFSQPDKGMLKAYKPRIDINYDFVLTLEVLERKFEKLNFEYYDNTHDFCENLGLVRKYGLNCIQEFSESFEYVFESITIESLPIQYALATFPYDLQKHNLLLLDHLDRNNLILESQRRGLENRYKGLLKKWEVYRLTIYKYIYLKTKRTDYNPDPNFFRELKNLLPEIYNEELQTAKEFSDILRYMGENYEQSNSSK